MHAVQSSAWRYPQPLLEVCLEYVLNPIPVLSWEKLETRQNGQRVLGTLLSTVLLLRLWLVTNGGALCAPSPESSRLPSTSVPQFPLGCLLHTSSQPTPKPFFSRPQFFSPYLCLSIPLSIEKKKSIHRAIRFANERAGNREQREPEPKREQV